MGVHQAQELYRFSDDELLRKSRGLLGRHPCQEQEQQDTEEADQVNHCYVYILLPIYTVRNEGATWVP